MKLQISLLALAVAASTTASADWWSDMVSEAQVVKNLQKNVGLHETVIQAIANQADQNQMDIYNLQQDSTALEGQVKSLEETRDWMQEFVIHGGELIKEHHKDLRKLENADKDHDARITNNADAIAKEAKTREEADDALLDLLAGEEKARIDADKKLTNDLAKEAKIREEADDALLDLLAGEEKARIDADKKLTNDLAKEAKTREEADTKERNERIAADNVLQGNIDQERAERKEGEIRTLAAANAYTDQKVNKLEKHYKAAVASSIAIASLPQPTTAGKNMFSIGAGTWESEQGYALGVSGVTMDNKWVYKVAASGDSRGNFGGGASVGFQW